VARCSSGNLIGLDLQLVHPVRQPLPCDPAELGRCGLLYPIQPRLVVIGAAGEHLALGEHIRLSTETPNPLDASDESCPVLRLDPAQLRHGRSSGQQPGQLLIHRPLHPGKLDAGTRGRLNNEEPADLPEVHVRRDIRGDLVVIHQPLVEA
jgi:hypothetical protein